MGAKTDTRHSEKVYEISKGDLGRDGDDAHGYTDGITEGYNSDGEAYPNFKELRVRQQVNEVIWATLAQNGIVDRPPD